MNDKSSTMPLSKSLASNRTIAYMAVSIVHIRRDTRYDKWGCERWAMRDIGANDTGGITVAHLHPGI